LTIRLLDFGQVSPVRSQTVYHAAAHALGPEGPDTIILVSSDRPYVSIGYHQDAAAEVDLAYCRERGLPVIRREVGGGAVYLDEGQVFAQWVFRQGRLPADLTERFSLYIRPLVETYRSFGVQAYHRPVNDIHVAGKKIGGTGAAQLGAADVVVGSLMFTFDKPAMARVLKVASEKMRDKVVESLEQYMTTLAEQLGTAPSREDVVQRYIAACTDVLGEGVEPGLWTPAEEARARALDERFASDAWLHEGGRGRPAWVKIHEDVRVAEGLHKAAGGLVRATVRLHAGRIDGLALSGDFTLLPADALADLEAAALGAAPDEGELAARFDRVYAARGIVSPGLAPADFARAVLAAGAVLTGQ
jgi:lipoate---protein ligase